MLRKIALSTLVAFVGGSALGWSGAVSSSTRVAYAVCGTFIGCGGGDGTVTSALDVRHVEGPTINGDPVEPDDGESWEIEAVWAGLSGTSCACTETSASVSADVTWTGSAWTVSCTGCNPSTGPIRSISICHIDGCTNMDTHSWEYRLIVDVDSTVGALCGRYLNRVIYTTTSIDDGDVIDTNDCTEASSVSPATQTVSATDYGAFECAFNCSGTAATATIAYE